MSDPVSHSRVRRQTVVLPAYSAALTALSACTVISALAISIYTPDLEPKVRGFVAVIVVYMIGCVLLYRTLATRAMRIDEAVGSGQIDAHLKILDDAREFFAGALDTADTFRLVTSRVHDMIEYDGCALLLLNDSRDRFVITQTNSALHEKGASLGLDSGIVGRCMRERDVVVDKHANVAAVPLRRETEVFGILLLQEVSTGDTSVLDAIAERAAPLFLASIAYERSQQNALTDAGTDLPNERAFHLVLENQVAEAVRRGGTRPLTILSFDVQDLDEICSAHGHPAADRVLNFVASTVKDDLRQMDFLARGPNEEFLAIMPTASKEISQEVVARIQTSLFGRKIKVSDVEVAEIELNFGWASFGDDGETPSALLAVARERKEQSRSSLSRSVLWFPQTVAH